MNTIYPVYTIVGGIVTPGAKVTKIELPSRAESPAITVGATDSDDSSLGYLLVSLAGAGHKSVITKWKRRGITGLVTASLEGNRHGTPYLQLHKNNHPLGSDGAIIVFRSEFPGGMNTRYFGDIQRKQDGKLFHGTFPGDILTYGIVSGKSRGESHYRRQWIAIIRPRTVFCTKYSNENHYGTSVHYYYLHENGLMSVWTEEERLANNGQHPIILSC